MPGKFTVALNGGAKLAAVLDVVTAAAMAGHLYAAVEVAQVEHKVEHMGGLMKPRRNVV